jgi:hypothetical protein
MVIRVRSDATQLYSEDPRWEPLGGSYRDWATRILNRITGMECVVIESGSGERGAFHNIRLDPAIKVPNLVGLPEEYTMMQIPAEYVSVIRSGFWKAS